MKPLPDGLQAHLDSGTTTLCHCWRLQLRDGGVMGFTDHDVNVTFDGTVFEAQAGFTGSEIESSLGLSVDNLEAAGALQSGRLDAQRLRKGDFDHAAIEIWRVNWAAPEQRLLLRKGHLGEVTLASGGFTVDVRGLADELAQPRGRVYQYGCDAVLGDSRCGVSLATPAFRRTATVVAASAATITIAPMGEPDGWLTHGTLTFASGVAAGTVLPIKRHQAGATADTLQFWQSFDVGPTVGDALVLTAGCDKQLAICISRFSNAQNFRGFPHMPGTGFVTAMAKAGDPANTGGRRS